MLPTPQIEDWTARIRETVARYDEVLLRRVAGKLFRPRIGAPLDELADKSAETQANAPVVDRRLRDLPEPGRRLLAVLGRSRQPVWTLGPLLTLLSAMGHTDGIAPLVGLLEAGVLFPVLPADDTTIVDFDSWIAASGGAAARVFAHPTVAGRARSEKFTLAQEPLTAFDPDTVWATLTSDGLEWPLRLAAVWQQVRAMPIRLTIAGTLFKRDLGRLQTDPLLSATVSDSVVTVPDAGLLALDWARGCRLIDNHNGELRHGAFAPAWSAGLFPTLTDLFAGLSSVESWDPIAGYITAESNAPATGTAGLLTLLLLADKPTAWFASTALAAWLWEHHPHWAGSLTKDVAKDGGRSWVEAYMLGVAGPLRVVDIHTDADGRAFRLSDFGRYLLADGPEPTANAFPQTLVVQPNAEILAYRQGLTPELISKLSRFAAWKAIGPACTLELTAEETYRGLENGQPLEEVIRTLDRHSVRPVPANVADLLRRWANKRDRVTVFASATLVEFATAADLDAALARGIVSSRLTDRVGVTADGSEPDFRSLRLTGNRDYEAKPQQCIAVAADGVTLTVDANTSDLLLEAEIVRVADVLPGDGTVRKFLLTPDTLKRATAQGMSLDDLDAWFAARTGGPLPPAGRLFVSGPTLPLLVAAPLLVVRTPTHAVADGLVQWPATAPYIVERLGPMALVVRADHLDALRDAVKVLGIEIAEPSD